MASVRFASACTIRRSICRSPRSALRIARRAIPKRPPRYATRRHKQTRASASLRPANTAALTCLGRADEAKAAARRVLELEPGFSIADFVRAHTGRKEIWTPIGEALHQVGLPE